ncbi:MAG: FAD-dependent oxidoreductase [Armatimonadetes bacterium]|nr:FAD-dependent oxidoreductase [Armatimonadota bacterium]
MKPRARRPHPPFLSACSLVVVAFVLAPASTPALAAPAAQAPEDRVDVLVVGGTSAGVAAALAAARRGKKTLLTEESDTLGSVLTRAWLATFDVNRGAKREHLTRGIFLEIFREMGMTFDVDKAKAVFHRKVASQLRLEARFRAKPVEAIHDGPRLVGVRFRDARSGAQSVVRAAVIIDATDDADLAVLAGTPYTIGREISGEDKAMQAASLIFRLGGVDRKEVARHLYRMGGVTNGVCGRYMWGYAEIFKSYKPIQRDTLILDMNMSWQTDGTVIINGLQIIGVDGTNPASVADGMARATAELPHIAAFLRQQAPGFASAELVDTAPILYIRETRHIQGLYTLTAKDITERRNFPDKIAVASYPIDLHPYHLGWRNRLKPERKTYSIPLRSLVPARPDGLVVASRAFSATWQAAGSARIVPTTMSMGEAAGVAAVVAIERGVTPREVATRARSTREVQDRLLAAGAYLTMPQDEETLPARAKRLAARIRMKVYDLLGIKEPAKQSFIVTC